MLPFSPTHNHFDDADIVPVNPKMVAKVLLHAHQSPIAVDGCPYCVEGGEVVFTRNSIKYGREYGDWSWCYFCTECKAYIGCHSGTVIPLGTLADQPTANARKAAHAAFDYLWRDGEMSRTDAYNFLATVLNIQRDQCHIGWFNVDMCTKVVTSIPQVLQLSRKSQPKVNKVVVPTLGDLFNKLNRGSVN